ncbi:MAG: hypothetical protein EP344_12565 [Bacteroidetes bacterium]|nr:MAG: hypothetical protein EP344_12565 [Bacteroidota bacterium]
MQAHRAETVHLYLSRSIMLLKWLFTFLAILWLIQALRPYFGLNQGIHQQQPPPQKDDHDEDDGEYIDYEEIK